MDPCFAGSSFEATWPRQNCLLARPPKQGDSNRTILRRWRPSVFLSRVTMYQSRNPWHLSQNYVTTSFIELVAWSQNYQYFPLSSINTLHSFHSGNKTYDYSPISVRRSLGRFVSGSVSLTIIRLFKRCYKSFKDISKGPVCPSCKNADARDLGLVTLFFGIGQ